MAVVIQRAKVPPLEAFKHFDKDGNNRLSQQEFSDALDNLGMRDLTIGEKKIVYGALDNDRDGGIDYKEFCGKLERHGMKTRSKQEQVIYQIIEAVERSNIKSMGHLFEIIDRSRTGIISKQDFRDIFSNLSHLKIDKNELDRFIEGFWKDNNYGIDYKSFLGIFTKYQIKFEDEKRPRNQVKTKPITEDTIRLKKEIFDKINIVLRQKNMEPVDLFKRVDKDGSSEIDVDELDLAFKNMRIDLSKFEVHQIFDSMDFDGDQQISMPELISDFFHTVKTDLNVLIAEQKQKEQNDMLADQDAEMMTALGMGVGDVGGNSQQRVLHLQTRLDISRAKEERSARNLQHTNQLYSQAKESLKHSEERSKMLLKELEDLQEKNATLTNMNIQYKQEQSQCIKKDVYANITEKMERLETDLVATRAAMISYKNMVAVVGDQVKNLKLLQERKKDEHENLLTSLREMQAENADKERIGKLYFIIMLSRWQEASVNKKYDSVCAMTKKLQGELLAKDMENQKLDHQNQEKEQTISGFVLEREKFKQQISNTKGVYRTTQEFDEKVRTIAELTDEKSGLEIELLNLRYQLREANEKVEEGQANIDTAGKLKEELLHANQDTISQKLIQMSDTLEKISLEKYRATRKAEEEERKVEYYSKLHKSMNEQVRSYEEKVAQLEGEIVRKEEYWRKQDNERVRLFGVANRFQDIDHSLSNSRIIQQPSARPDIAKELDRSVNLSVTSTTRLGVINEERGIERQRTESYIKNTVTPRKQTGTFGGNQHQNENQDQLHARIESLQREVSDLVQKTQNQADLLQKYDNFQLQNNYLSQDGMIKEAIDDTIIKQNQVKQQENKEMADAAYQTIKTMQEMLDQKNEQLKRKEEHIQNLRDEMKNQANQDAMIINKLKQDISITGNNTLNQMQQIVMKNPIDDKKDLGVQQRQTQLKQDQMMRSDLQNELGRKDDVIKKLQMEIAGFNKSSNRYLQQNQILKAEVDDLQDKLRREQENGELKAANKKLLRLQKERENQDKNIAILNTAIEKLKLEQGKFILEQDNQKTELQVQEQNKILQEKNIKKLKEQSNGQVKLQEKRNEKITKENQDLKVAAIEKDDKIKKYIAIENALNQQVQRHKSEVEKERIENQKLKTELNSIKAENRNIGGMDGRDVKNMVDRNKDLEEQVNQLLGEKQQVVVLNKDDGTMECIAEARSLNYPNSVNGMPNNVKDIVDRTEDWLKKYDNRITVKSIFESMDKDNTGELRPDQFCKAMERIGIKISPKELQMLKEVLDPRDIGFMRYTPLIMQLRGVQAKEFTNPDVEKIARMVVSRDLTRNDFQDGIDPTRRQNLDLREFTDKIKGLCAPDDFTFDDRQAQNVFLVVTGQPKPSAGVKMDVTKFVEIVFQAVHAVLVDRMQASLRRSNKYLSDILVTHDKNKDGFLEYAEFESMLLEIQVTFKAKTMEQILIKEIMDVGGKKSKISFDKVKHVIGDNISGGGLDITPSLEEPSNREAGSLKPTQMKEVKVAARKILIGFNGQLSDQLTKEDTANVGLLKVDKIRQKIEAKQIKDLKPSELNLLLNFCDPTNYGFVVIPNFCTKLNEQAQETKSEVQLRRFAKSIGHQNVSLPAVMKQYSTPGKDTLEQIQFKRAMKQLSVSMNDQEIKEIHSIGLESQAGKVPKGQLDIPSFCKMVEDAAKQRALPSFIPQEGGKDTISRIGQGVGMKKEQTKTQDFELERKYKKSIQALTQEIEERNLEIKNARDAVQNEKGKVSRLEEEKRKLETRLVDRNAKPPAEMKKESVGQGEADEIQRLKEEIFHTQQVNQALQKTIQVNFQAELKRVSEEKDILDERLKNTTEKLRNKTHELNMVIGLPMDNIGKREEQEEVKAKRIEELEADLEKSEERANSLQEKLFEAEEKNLDLKFEKETFDLQYARLQKRITDLEQYKNSSSQLSAVLKNQREEELATIHEQSAKLTGEDFAKQPGETVKLRSRGTKSVAELELVVDSLRRVIDKQKVQLDKTNKENSKMSEKLEKSGNEPALRRRIEELEQALHSQQMKEVNNDEQEQTIKKLIFSNRQLREDMTREIERYNLLEGKFKDLLIKYNLLSKENNKNKEVLFTMHTGAKLPKYDNFLDDEGEFGKGKKASTLSRAEDQNSLNDELNAINKESYNKWKQNQ